MLLHFKVREHNRWKAKKEDQALFGTGFALKEMIDMSNGLLRCVVYLLYSTEVYSTEDHACHAYKIPAESPRSRYRLRLILDLQ
jgi:hypothetical protein